MPSPTTCAGKSSRDGVTGAVWCYPDDGSEPYEMGAGQGSPATTAGAAAGGGAYGATGVSQGDINAGLAIGTAGSTTTTQPKGKGPDPKLVYDPEHPIVGSFLPNTNRVYAGQDRNDNPIFITAGRSTTVVNNKLVDSETGDVIADYGATRHGATAGRHQVVNVGGHQVVVDTATGQQIADLGPVTPGAKAHQVVSVGGRELVIDPATGATVKDLGPVTQHPHPLGQYGGLLYDPMTGKQVGDLGPKRMTAEEQARLGLDQQKFGLTQQELDVKRGSELLRIGSRPDTLLRYLYAIRGMQPPQGAMNAQGEFSPQALPGFAPGNYGAAPGYPPSAGAGAPAVTSAAPAAPAAPAAAGAAPPLKRPPAPPLKPPLPAPLPLPPQVTLEDIQPEQNRNIPKSAVTVEAPIGAGHSEIEDVGGRPQFQTTMPAQEVSLAAGWTPDAFLRALSKYAEGGVVPEPVIGTGLLSGQPYTFNEETLGHPERAETVVPAGKTLSDVRGRSGTRLRFGGKIAAKAPKPLKAGTTGKPQTLSRIGRASAGMNNMMKMPVRGAEVPSVGGGQNGLGMNLPGAYASGGVIGYRSGGTLGAPSIGTSQSGFAVPIPGQAHPGEVSANRTGTRGVNFAHGLGPHQGGPGINKFNDNKKPSATSRIATTYPINMFQGGGTLGYMSPSLFNPSRLNAVSSAKELYPGVPNLPQLGAATGGTSLIPSAQRWNMLTPTEQQAYKGVALDQFGIEGEDIQALTRKLSPSQTSSFSALGRVLRGVSPSQYGQGEKS